MALDLAPVYALQERLTAAALAGTGLLAEDFRLRRALDAFAPLEAASPVFARVGQQVRALLAPDCADPAGGLLDALNLLDAVLCTQAVVRAPSPVQPVTLPQNQLSVPLQVPYSTLQPLLEALRSGRAQYVSEQHFAHPELFRDPRVRIAMVDALAAARSDLADRVQHWLCFGGETDTLLPLLKKGFDPKGGKGMARRVQVIDAIAGAAENDFYCAQLEQAEGEVRQALLFALRSAPQNADLLLALARTERGKAKKLARFSLSFMDSPEVWAFWKKELAKKPETVADMGCTAAPEASRMIAGQLLPRLEMVTRPMSKEEREEAGRMTPLVDALVGKSGPEICEVYRYAAQVARRIQSDPAYKKKADGIKVLESLDMHTVTSLFCTVLPEKLCTGLIANPAPDLLALAEELYLQYGSVWMGAYLIAGLLTLPADQAYLRLETALSRPEEPERPKGSLLLPAELTHLRRELAQSCGGDPDLQLARSRCAQLKGALRPLQWNRLKRCYELRLEVRSPVEEYRGDLSRPLLHPLDPRWVDLLCRLDEPLVENILVALIRPEDAAQCKQIGEVLYRQALECELPFQMGICIDALRLCGWPTCKGLGTRWVMRRGYLEKENVENLLHRLPGSAAEVAQEADRIYAMSIARTVELLRCSKSDFYALASQWHQRAAAEAEAAKQKT